MDTSDYDDYRCPCCMIYIYNNYQCGNGHNLCNECYLKVTECPICRVKGMRKSKIGSDILKKECKNKSRGCEMQLYHFDDDHEIDCIFKQFHCKFCNNNINDDNINLIRNHYESNCANIFKLIKFKYNDVNRGEKEGRKFKIQSMKPELSFINIDDNYIVVVIPRLSKEKISFMVFSPNSKYKQSNYKINILNTNGNVVLTSPIYYNAMHDFSVSTDAIFSSQNLMNFTIQNMFLIEPKVNSYKYGNTQYHETYHVKGEPGSPGNWSQNDFDEVFGKFTNMFRK